MDTTLANEFIAAHLARARSGCGPFLGSVHESRANWWLCRIDQMGLVPNVQTAALFCLHSLERCSSDMETPLEILKRIGRSPRDLLDCAVVAAGPIRKRLVDMLVRLGELKHPEDAELLTCGDAKLDALLVSAVAQSNTPEKEAAAMKTRIGKRLKEHCITKESFTSPASTANRLISLKLPSIQILQNTLARLDTGSVRKGYRQQKQLETMSYDSIVTIAMQEDAKDAGLETAEPLSKPQPESVQRKPRGPAESLRKLVSLSTGLAARWHKEFVPIVKQAVEPLCRGEASSEVAMVAPFLLLVRPEVLSDIVVSQFMALAVGGLRDDESIEALACGRVRAVALVNAIGTAIIKAHCSDVQQSMRGPRMEMTDSILHHLGSAGLLFDPSVRDAATKVVRMQADTARTWRLSISEPAKVMIGSFLAHRFMKMATVPVHVTNGKTKPRVVPNGGKLLGVITPHPVLLQMISNKTAHVAPIHLPMITPPRPWLTASSGGYLWHRSPLMRIKSNPEHEAYLHEADSRGNLGTVLCALDVLGSTGWRVNDKVFDVAVAVWNSNEDAPGIPKLLDIPEIAAPSQAELRVLDPQARDAAQRKYLAKCEERKRRVHTNLAQRCEVNHRLEIARAFKGKDMYFPHNIDFRGRAYPMASHLHHMGNDLTRGLLKFQRARRLGDAGVRWLKIHLSNMAGNDKVPLDERVRFTDTHMAEIADSAARPLEGRRWWLTGAKPWQLLAACMELHAAINSGDAAAYESTLPVHQDGSCNGLQHYAALGRDEPGGREVNLVPSDVPRDVYMRVADSMRETVREHAFGPMNNREAYLMHDSISRKLVKQTVMTHTYGVTVAGARAQIGERIGELQADPDLPSTARLSALEAERCASYLADRVFDSVGELFQSAKAIQKWLNDVAKLVTHSVRIENIKAEQIEDSKRLSHLGLLPGKLTLDHDTKDESAEGDLTTDVAGRPLVKLPHAVQRKVLARRPPSMDCIIWTTPLSLPVAQPYRKQAVVSVRTGLQTFSVMQGGQAAAAAPVDSHKQSTALPPNFVHSLDASHMMMSAVGCRARGIVFAAVHDSFWTHAGDVDTMNAVLRDEFVRLHEHDIMRALKDELALRYARNKVPVDVTVRGHEACREWVHGCGASAATSARPVGVPHRSRAVGGNSGVEALKVAAWIDLQLPKLPPKGTLDLSQVRKSTYFFH
ncbi:DNA-directed RNA polymerase [Polyrhizophydium stewartii]|uniref:DNA-directed RNA polymerase n=1 Tax=Polyrhizophydium stewartii TaxID=2732419 RepID=A0ABR4NF22_9FUNG